MSAFANFNMAGDRQSLTQPKQGRTSVPDESLPGIDLQVTSGMVENGLLGNYIGPMWSNGKFQESVEWGDLSPTDELDLAAYYHDSAYARYKDASHRRVADQIFAEQVKDLPGGKAAIARLAVTHGNTIVNGLKRLTTNSAFGAVTGAAALGIVYSGLQNMKDSYDMLPGGKDEKSKKEVLAYHETDPYKRQNMFKKPAGKPAGAVIQETVATHDHMGGPIIHGKPTETEKQDKVSFQQSQTPAPDEAGIRDPRSMFQRLFKRGKKKKNKVVPMETEEQRNKRLSEAQNARFKKHLKLRDAALKSSLKKSNEITLLPTGPKWAQERQKKAYSNKRLRQGKL